MMNYNVPDYDKMTRAFNAILPVFESLNTGEMLPIIFTLIDTAAGRDGFKGYEMMQEFLPMLKEVGDGLGVLG